MMTSAVITQHYVFRVHVLRYNWKWVEQKNVKHAKTDSQTHTTCRSIIMFEWEKKETESLEYWTMAGYKIYVAQHISKKIV